MVKRSKRSLSAFSASRAAFSENYTTCRGPTFRGLQTRRKAFSYCCATCAFVTNSGKRARIHFGHVKTCRMCKKRVCNINEHRDLHHRQCKACLCWCSNTKTYLDHLETSKACKYKLDRVQTVTVGKTQRVITIVKRAQGSSHLVAREPMKISRLSARPPHSQSMSSPPLLSPSTASNTCHPLASVTAPSRHAPPMLHWPPLSHPVAGVPPTRWEPSVPWLWPSAFHSYAVPMTIPHDHHHLLPWAQPATSPAPIVYPPQIAVHRASPIHAIRCSSLSTPIQQMYPPPPAVLPPPPAPPSTPYPF